MGVHMSKDQVSRLCRGLDEQVQAFRERPLEGRYPYVWLDGKIGKVRERGGVRQKCLVIAYGVHETGRREVIGLDVGEGETEAFRREFLRSLHALAALHRAFAAQHARALRQEPAADDRRRDPRHLHRRHGTQARERLAEVVERLQPIAPKVAQLLLDAEDTDNKIKEVPALSAA
jgi:hypothetical protein